MSTDISAGGEGALPLAVKPLVVVENKAFDYDVQIKEVAVRFFYTETGEPSETRGSGRVNATPGQTVAVSGTKKLCCTAAKVIVELAVNGEKVVLEGADAPEPPDKCIVRSVFAISPTNKSGASLSDSLQLTIE